MWVWESGSVGEWQCGTVDVCVCECTKPGGCDEPDGNVDGCVRESMRRTLFAFDLMRNFYKSRDRTDLSL